MKSFGSKQIQVGLGFGYSEQEMFEMLHLAKSKNLMIFFLSTLNIFKRFLPKKSISVEL